MWNILQNVEGFFLNIIVAQMFCFEGSGSGLFNESLIGGAQ